jgi:UDP-2,3-diacylglucosamine hydrolase
MLNLNLDAIFLADTHYNNQNRTELKQILLDILNGKTKTSQLILLGDIFDFLAPQIKYFVKQNQTIIDILNQLSRQIQIVYLEGNHDFNLQSLFPKIIVIPRANQPYICKQGDKLISLAHGDIFTSIGYEFYTMLIRNRFILFLINLIDINNWITKKLNIWLINKNIKNTYPKDIDNFIDERIKLYKKYNVDKIIEGHFHYKIANEKYVNV